jgi:ATP-binding cassette, subfamily C, bacterial LapB
MNAHQHRPQQGVSGANEPRGDDTAAEAAVALGAAGLRTLIAHWRSTYDDAQTPFDSPAAHCLKPLLAALGWSGAQRYLREAVGTEGGLATLSDLRSALYRLNYATTRVNCRLADLPAGQFPVLVERDGGDIWVILGREPDGRFTAFKGSVGMAALAPADTGGRIYTVAHEGAPAKAAGRAASTWSGGVIAGEARTVRTLFALTLAVNVVALAVPIYLIAVFDRAIAAKSLSSLFYLLAGVLLAVWLENVLREMRARGLAYLGARIEGLTMTDAFKRLLLLPAHLIENASVSAQLGRLKLFESLREVFSGPLAAALLDLPFVLIFVFAVFVIGGSLGWLIVAFMALLTLLIALAVPAARRHAAGAGELRAESQRFLMEFTDNIEIIRRCGAEQVWIDRYRTLTEGSLKHGAAAHRTGVIEQTLSQSLVLVTGAAIIGCGAYLVMEGAFTAGALFALMSLVWRVLAPIQTAFLHLNKLSQAASIIRQLDQLMRIPPEYRPDVVPTVPRSFKGPIEMQSVVMRYSARAEPAIRGVSFQVPQNGFVAITGHVGSGKSTLLKIMAQLYWPQSGTVLIDGLDYRQFDARLLRHGIGFLPQRQDVFSGSIAENIRLARPEATDAEIVAMLEEIGGENLLDGVAEGIDAPVEAAHPVTGSEAFRQKIMLARALLGGPAILLLDEPSARLNARDDERVRSKLLSLKGRATIVLATTRPAYMVLADRLVVLKAGQAVANDAPHRVLEALLGDKFHTAAASPAASSPASCGSPPPAEPMGASPTASATGAK